MGDLISLVIINWNNLSFIKRCVDSIKIQTYKNIELIFIDNNSSDESFDYFTKEYSSDGFIAVRNENNLGYAGAANQGINMSHGSYIMIINPDIVMEENFIEMLYEGITSKDGVAAVSGKLLKYDFKNDTKLNYIDSAGIDMYRSRRCVDRGQNEPDIGQYENSEEVFGVCGAAPIYSREALEKIKVDEQYFDEDFFAYKEDVDLSWRLNLAGYKCLYYPKAVAYHGRGLGGSRGGVKNFIRNRKGQSEFLRGISCRNHIMMLYKNETKDSFKRDKINILKREGAFFIYSILFERFNFKYYREAMKNKEKMYRKKEVLVQKLNGQTNDVSYLIKE